VTDDECQLVPQYGSLCTTRQSLFTPLQEKLN
jgi:hypothetical protein